MAIADQLMQLSTIKQAMRDALASKGVDMTGVPFSDYPMFMRDVAGAFDPYARDAYRNGFEVNADGFAGQWVRSTLWAHDGTHSLASGNPGAHGTVSTSTLQLTLDREATLSFQWYVSSEANYDKLTVTVNNVAVVNQVSGTQGGAHVSVVPAGALNVTVTYVKDSSDNAGLDRAFVDDVLVRYNS